MEGGGEVRPPDLFLNPFFWKYDWLLSGLAVRRLPLTVVLAQFAAEVWPFPNFVFAFEVCIVLRDFFLQTDSNFSLSQN